MNALENFADFDRNLVYVKEVSAATLPEDVRAEAGDVETVFAVHNAQGDLIALVANRKLAFHIARENEMVPVTLH